MEADDEGSRKEDPRISVATLKNAILNNFRRIVVVRQSSVVDSSLWSVAQHF